MFLGMTLTACALPTAQPKPSFSTIAASIEKFDHATPAVTAVVPNWWAAFDDPELVRLVELALAENRDLAVARANLETANGLLRAAQLGRSYSTSTNVGSELGRSLGPNRDLELSLSGGVGASWEYDAFGGLEAQIKAASYSREAVAQSQRDVAVIIASQTAQAYVDLRGAQQRLIVAQQNADLQQEGLSLLRDLVENGRSTELDLNRSETLYRTTLASLQTFKAAEETSAAQLMALTGRTEVGLELRDNLLINPAKVPAHTAALITGTPQELIERRPDIRQAEAEVSRRLALSDVERSRLFPKLIFNADIGALFNGTNRIDQLSSFSFGIGPAISWEGPDLRSVRVDIDISDKQTEAAIAQYEQSVMVALSEVESSLSLYAHELDRRDDLQRATSSARNALELARLRFDEGLDDFLDVLDAQRTLLDVEDRSVQNDILVTTYAISAYRALGGMWSEDELASAANN